MVMHVDPPPWSELILSGRRALHFTFVYAGFSCAWQSAPWLHMLYPGGANLVCFDCTAGRTYESKRATTMCRFEYTSCIWFPAADGCCKKVWLFLVLLQWPFSVLCSPCFHGFLVETSTKLWSCQRHRTPDAPILSVEQQPCFHHVFYEVFNLSGGKGLRTRNIDIYIYIIYICIIFKLTYICTTNMLILELIMNQNIELEIINQKPL